MSDIKTMTTNNDVIEQIRIFESIEHVKGILKEYKDRIFRDRIISNSLLELLCDYFLRDQNETVTKNKYLDFIDKLLIELCKNFSDDEIYTDSETPFAEGTYGEIYATCDDRTVAKIYKIDDELKINKNRTDSKNKNVIFDSSIMKLDNRFYMYGVELFTYILWKTVLMYVSDNYEKIQKQTNNTKIRQELEKIGKIDLDDYLAEIYSPFIVIIDDDSDVDELDTDEIDDCFTNRYRNMTFVIGHYMRRYDNIINDLLIGKTDTKQKYKLLMNMINMVDEINALSLLGINLIHRDIRSGNIVIEDNNKVRMIDMGLSLTSIDCKNNDKIRHGQFCDKKYRFNIVPYYDIILFMLEMICYYEKEVDIKEFTDELNNIFKIDKDRINNTTIWIYPFQNCDTTYMFNQIYKSIKSKL